MKPWLEVQRIKGATIDEAAALDLINDIDDAVRRRSIVEIRAFAREAELSGLDQEASRAREIADVLESKAGASAREELLRIKSAIEPLGPTQADLVRRYDREFMARGGSFSVNTFEADEARRVETQNEQLRKKQRRHEAQREAQVAAAAEPKGPGR